MTTTATTQPAAPRRIDPRGPQFAAALTALVLALVLVTAPGPVGIVLLGRPDRRVRDRRGPRRAALAVLPGSSARWSGPGSAPPAELEDPRPAAVRPGRRPGFAVVGLVGYLAGADPARRVATGFALVAALLNAVFGSAWAARCTCSSRIAAAGTSPPSRNA